MIKNQDLYDSMLTRRILTAEGLRLLFIIREVRRLALRGV
jgi:hypothetical protein